jgi:hypothetical protein
MAPHAVLNAKEGPALCLRAQALAAGFFELELVNGVAAGAQTRVGTEATGNPFDAFGFDSEAGLICCNPSGEKESRKNSHAAEGEPDPEPPESRRRIAWGPEERKPKGSADGKTEEARQSRGVYPES